MGRALIRSRGKVGLRSSRKVILSGESSVGRGRLLGEVSWNLAATEQDGAWCLAIAKQWLRNGDRDLQAAAVRTFYEFGDCSQRDRVVALFRASRHEDLRSWVADLFAKRGRRERNGGHSTSRAG